MKKVIGLIGFLLFVGMAIVGVKFIFQAEQSAVQLEQSLPTTPVNRIQDINLSPQVSGSPNLNENETDTTNTAPSNGKDATIVRGEFAYRASRPEVNVILKNEANFPIYAVHISLFLRLNGEKNNVAEALGVPVILDKPLAQGESVRVNVPVSAETWSADNVAQAQSRQVLVQIASVSTTENDAASDVMVDYPQTSGFALIKQTANDWLPSAASDVLPSDLPQTNLPNTSEASAPAPEIAEPKTKIRAEQQISEEKEEEQTPQPPLDEISHEEKTWKK